MKEINKNSIKQILEGNSENLNLEFKASFDFVENVWARERLIRAILAMSNTRSGGYVVIGIKEDTNKTFSFNGIEEKHLIIFKSKLEDLKSKIESFSSSPVNYEIGIGKYEVKKEEKNIVLIAVTEFILNPLICRKNGDYKKSGEDNHRILEEGAIYIRTLKDKPSSVKLTNPIDIQDFLERAIDKQIINLHNRGWKHDTEKSTKNKSFFKKERENF